MKWLFTLFQKSIFIFWLLILLETVFIFPVCPFSTQWSTILPKTQYIFYSLGFYFVRKSKNILPKKQKCKIKKKFIFIFIVFFNFFFLRWVHLSLCSLFAIINYVLDPEPVSIRWTIKLKKIFLPTKKKTKSFYLK